VVPDETPTATRTKSIQSSGILEIPYVRSVNSEVFSITYPA
jgi:hypothetical protein